MAQDVATYAFSPDEIRSLVPGREYKLGIRLTASTTYPKGQALRLVTSSTTNTYQMVVSGDTPECILPFDCITDASGNITLGDQVGGGWPGGNTQTTVQAFFGGVFQMSDIVTAGTNGLTAAMITAATSWSSKLAGKILSIG
jgi:hypothetical protein